MESIIVSLLIGLIIFGLLGYTMGRVHAEQLREKEDPKLYLQTAQKIK